jgi:hypothetical protein
MLWSRIIVASNTAYNQCSDSNNLKLQRSRSAASSLRRRFGKISSRRESYRADPELLQRFGRLFSPPDVRSIISGCGSHARQSLHQSPRNYAAPCSTLPLAFIASSSLLHDSLNASAPFDCRSAASLSRSIPALLKSARTRSQSPPSRGSVPVTLPWSPNASRVFSGMVLIVFGAASALM